MNPYSQLNIHQKIALKAYTVKHAKTFQNSPKNWFVMKADFIVFDLLVYNN